jgi:amidase
MKIFKEYADFDALGLAQLIRSQEVSVLEVLEAAIARVETHNPRLNAVVSKMYDAARAQCARPDEGPLAGVPFLIKDLSIDRQGSVTSQSCRFFAEDVAKSNSELMKRFDKMGLVTLGKTNTPELGIVAVTESEYRGPCRNPWDVNLTPGGSSGGSAAAVASRMVPVAHADDGGGSIRIPASACGLVGLKPSRGRTPVGPGKLEAWGGFVSPHVVTRSVRDCAAILDGIHGTELGSPYQPPAPETTFTAALERAPRKLRIAFSLDSLLTENTHPECQRAILEAVELCKRLGHEVVEAQPMLDKARLRETYFVIVATSIAQDLDMASRRLNKVLRRKFFEPSTWFLYVLGQQLRAADLSGAIFQMRQVGQNLASFFETYDVFITSTMGAPPSPVGELQPTFFERTALAAMSALPSRKVMMTAIGELAAEMLAKTPNTQLFNMSGTPAINLPISMSEKNVPIGVQFATRYGDEETLLALAQKLEEATCWDRRAPAALKGPDSSPRSSK